VVSLAGDRREEPVEALLGAVAMPDDPAVHTPHIGPGIGVVLEEPHARAHVEKVPDRGAGVAGAGQLGEVGNDVPVLLENASVDQRAGDASDQ
jgi:hypothetical protein